MTEMFHQRTFNPAAREPVPTAPVQVPVDAYGAAHEAIGAVVDIGGGGARLEIDGGDVVEAERAEYPRIYRRFADLIDERRSLVDVTPMRLTADAFLVGRRLSVAPFSE